MADISYQMYCSRDHDIAQTMSMLAGMGYKAIEGYGPLYSDADATRSLMVENGLTMPTGHFSIDAVEDTSGVLEIANALGVDNIIVPFIAPDQRPTDLAGWQAFGARLAAAAGPIVAAGKKFGWHNHEFEFAPLENGQTPLEVIMDASDDISLELDLGWVMIAGHNPVDLINKYADRLIAVHVKDIAAEGECVDEDGWADVGHGVVDWQPIVAALSAAGVTRFVIEHDKPSDHERFASRSLASVQSF